MSERIPVELTGTKTTAFSADPKEYRGMSVSQIAANLLTIAAQIDPGVSFFPDEVSDYAVEIACAANAIAE